MSARGRSADATALCRLLFSGVAAMLMWGCSVTAEPRAAQVQPEAASTAPAPPPAAELRGAAALQSLLDRLRYVPVVRLRGPAAVPGTPSGLSMTIHIGENRVYPFSNLNGKRTLELGALEPGWTTFRFAGVNTFSVVANGKPKPLLTNISCSGGFEVRGDEELEIVLVQEADGLACAIR